MTTTNDWLQRLASLDDVRADVARELGGYGDILDEVTPLDLARLRLAATRIVQPSDPLGPVDNLYSIGFYLPLSLADDLTLGWLLSVRYEGQRFATLVDDPDFLFASGYASFEELLEPVRRLARAKLIVLAEIDCGVAIACPFVTTHDMRGSMERIHAVNLSCLFCETGAEERVAKEVADRQIAEVVADYMATRAREHEAMEVEAARLVAASA